MYNVDESNKRVEDAMVEIKKYLDVRLPYAIESVQKIAKVVTEAEGAEFSVLKFIQFDFASSIKFRDCS